MPCVVHEPSSCAALQEWPGTAGPGTPSLHALCAAACCGTPQQRTLESCWTTLTLPSLGTSRNPPPRCAIGEPEAARRAGVLAVTLSGSFMALMAVIILATRGVLGYMFSTDPGVVSTIRDIAIFAALFQVTRALVRSPPACWGCTCSPSGRRKLRGAS